MHNVTVEKLEKKFPGEGEARFCEIASIGGFGDDSNTVITPAKKDKIRELVGLTEEAPKKSTKEGK
jgi:hypothetical protein